MQMSQRHPVPWGVPLTSQEGSGGRGDHASDGIGALTLCNRLPRLGGDGIVACFQPPGLLLPSHSTELQERELKQVGSLGSLEIV